MVAGVKQGGREIIACIQKQFDDAGYEETIVLPPELLAENDVI